MRLFIRVFNGLVYAGAVIAAALIVFLTLSVTYGVIMRYILGRPPMWVFESTELSLLYFTFFSAAWILREDAHVNIDIVMHGLRPKAKAVLNAITSILCAAACFVLVWYSAKTTWQHFRMKLMEDKVLPIPEYVILAIVPIGVFLLLVELVKRSFGNVKEARMPQTTK